MRAKSLYIIMAAMLMLPWHKCNAQTASQMPDTEQLQIALEYFSSGKYDEALNLLVRLDKKYKLNPRFKAYIGLCYYHQWEFKKVCQYIDPFLDHLEIYAPHERSIYYYTSAESHFALEEYVKAIPLYEKMLLVCYDKEKGDAFFKLAFCHMNCKEWQNAKEMLNEALAHYERFGYPENKQARVIQIEKMIAGCEKEQKAMTANKPEQPKAEH